VPKFPTKDPNHRILARQKSRFTHNYFYIRDEVLGPMVMRVATFFPFQTTYYLNGHSFIEQELNRANIAFRKNDNAFLAVDDVGALQAAADKLSPAIIRERLDYWTFILGPKFSAKERKKMNFSRFYSISQIEYCRNFIFKRNFPIHKLFERSCELGLWRLTAHKISEIFGQRLHRKISDKLATVIDQVEHGHHVFRAYFKHAFLKQYEKFCTFLRNELCSNNLRDFGLKKSLDNLEAVREKFQTITSRFAGYQAQWLNVHVDFPLLQRIALPIIIGSVRYPGIQIHQTRIIRLMEVLLHGGTYVGGWTAKEIHEAVLTTFGLSETSYRLNQLRYESSRVMPCWSGTDRVMPTASRPKASRLLSCSSSFTNGCADPLPTAAFIISPMPDIDPTAGSRRPIIAPMRRSRKSSICSPPLDAPALDSFSQTSLWARIYSFQPALY
jgi:hypothetical protein